MKKDPIDQISVVLSLQAIESRLFKEMSKLKSRMNQYQNKDLRKFIESIPQEEVDRQNHLHAENNEREYKQFSDALKIGKCFLCAGQMNSFEVMRPCFHWFTHPTGIKKKHFDIYLKNPIGFFQLDSYFRWLANTERPIGNINDLKSETSSTSYLETTFKYKNIEWAISIGHTDKEGHPDSQIGSSPHFHIQMKVDGRVFLKFNDYHIPFSDYDLFNMTMLEQVSDKVKLDHSYGKGIGILEEEEILKILDDAMKVSHDFEKASFQTQSIILVPKGKTIPTELIEQAIEKSKKTNEPLRKILQRLLPDANIITQLNPGSGVPKMTKRSGKK